MVWKANCKIIVYGDCVAEWRLLMRRRHYHSVMVSGAFLRIMPQWRYVLIEVGNHIGHENIVSASRMNQAVVVFLKEQNLVNRLIVSGLTV